ncbi:MAG: hypothetical protein EXR93_07265 [Gemmatimonadetes bacterium]|nr:hypothetical protein [Gemmatimonadota bacterium]
MFTLIHVLISVVGLGAGFGILAGLLNGKQFNGMTGLFLVSTVLTNATGFGFPFFGLHPSHIVAAISLVVLAVTIYAYYARRLAGRWRRVYVAGAVMALYFNVFLLLTQLFRKVPAMFELAPTQSEAPFAASQGLVFLVFAWLGWRAMKRFTPGA